MRSYNTIQLVFEQGLRCNKKKTNVGYSDSVNYYKKIIKFESINYKPISLPELNLFRLL